MLRFALIAVFQAILAASPASQRHKSGLSESENAKPPSLAVKAEIKVLHEGKDPIVLAAKKPEMVMRANIFAGEKFWRFMYPIAGQTEVPAGSLVFTTTADPNDMAGGGFYLCSTKKDGDKVYFNISTFGGGAPKNDFATAKPAEISSTKNPDGTFTFKVAKPLAAGVYALYFADNQYAWPFVVK